MANITPTANLPQAQEQIPAPQSQRIKVRATDPITKKVCKLKEIAFVASTFMIRKTTPTAERKTKCFEYPEALSHSLYAYTVLKSKLAKQILKKDVDILSFMPVLLSEIKDLCTKTSEDGKTFFSTHLFTPYKECFQAFFKEYFKKSSDLSKDEHGAIVRLSTFHTFNKLYNSLKNDPTQAMMLHEIHGNRELRLSFRFPANEYLENLSECGYATHLTAETTSHITELMYALEQNPNLTHLRFSACSFNSQTAALFATTLETNQTIKGLKLTDVTIDQEDLRIIINSLALNTTLETLLIRNIDAQTAQALLTTLESNQTLNDIHIVTSYLEDSIKQELLNLNSEDRKIKFVYPPAPKPEPVLYNPLLDY